jgi:hypothetical protein
VLESKSELTLDDLTLPLDNKGDDYYDQVEEELLDQDEVDRKGIYDFHVHF